MTISKLLKYSTIQGGRKVLEHLDILTRTLCNVLNILELTFKICKVLEKENLMVCQKTLTISLYPYISMA